MNDYIIIAAFVLFGLFGARLGHWISVVQAQQITQLRELQRIAGLLDLIEDRARSSDILLQEMNGNLRTMRARTDPSED